ncbi:MAG: hypothetical protein AUH37_03745 [Candidatus Nitrososphaera sp. 13_1_40CM_48_12]|nr:MAG: hypothetical protein AUH37_03745 [Candidatus Nitrososphaera sp. 13_1_40CM_48_12]
MSSRFLAFALVASLLVFGTLSVALTKSAFAADDLWYPGEGVKKDVYLTYRIQELDTANGDPFIMTMWFQEQQDSNWIVPTYVEFEGRVIQGTMKLSEGMAYLAGSNQVPAEMNEFIGGYASSLHWLDAFTTKSEPLSLKAGSWGKIAAIGGAEIKPAGTEKVSFQGARDVCQADSCDATLVSWHKGVDNKIWIVNEFPFPVKAETFAEQSIGGSVTQFKFELLKVGAGQPNITATGEVPKPPLERKTSSGKYAVTLKWEPAEIQPGSNVNFGISFADNTHVPLKDVRYDFTVKDANGIVIVDLKDQRSEIGGPEIHSVKLNSSGTIRAEVVITAIEGQTTGQTIESAEFNVVVVPEFPVNAAIVVATVIGLVVVITRTRGTSIGSTFGNRGNSP